MYSTRKTRVSSTKPGSPMRLRSPVRLSYRVSLQFNHHHIVEEKEVPTCECNEPARQPFEHMQTVDFDKESERYELCLTSRGIESRITRTAPRSTSGVST